MRVIQVTAKADSDGVIRLNIPVRASGSEYETGGGGQPPSGSHAGRFDSTEDPRGTRLATGLLRERHRLNRR
jgi:hypothetical protein